MKSLKARLKDWTVVARGNLSVCYRAQEIALDRPVFVKALAGANDADEDMRARFAREARAVARLDHPNLVRLYEFGEDEEIGLYMMLEWVEGVTLAERLHRGGPLDRETLTQLAIDLLSGLSELHTAGILHRDIKPENILLRQDGSAKISDFSLAALRDAPRLTHHLAIVGTPAYMAPEQAAGKAPDERSDLFAVGVVLYEAATASNPFAADDVIETLRRIRRIDPPLDAEAIQTLPDELRRLLSACLEKNPASRPQQASEALRWILPEGTPHARHSSRAKSWRSGAAALIVIAILGVGAVLVGRFNEPQLPAVARQDSVKVAPERRDSVRTVVPPDTGLQAEIPPVEQREKPETVSRKIETTEAVQPLQVPAPTPPQTVVADSVAVWIEVQPWAHVYHRGRYLGTTPMRQPVRLPVGKQTLSFVNSSLPRIEHEFDLSSGTSRIEISLADYVVTLDVHVQPWGEVFVDGESFGTTPLPQPLFFSPGTHTLRITHTNLPSVEKSFDAPAGDTIRAAVDLDHSEVSLAHHRGNPVHE
jgi:eukaryotic-like serine/threonine-protein kinase